MNCFQLTLMSNKLIRFTNQNTTNQSVSSETVNTAKSIRFYLANYSVIIDSVDINIKKHKTRRKPCENLLKKNQSNLKRKINYLKYSELHITLRRFRGKKKKKSLLLRVAGVRNRREERRLKQLCSLERGWRKRSKPTCWGFRIKNKNKWERERERERDGRKWMSNITAMRKVILSVITYGERERERETGRLIYIFLF